AAAEASPSDSGGSADAAMEAASDGCAQTWSKCQNCIANGCSMELVACTMNMPCHDALTALAMCVNSCGAMCKQTFQSASGSAGMNLLAFMSASLAAD